MSNEHVFFKAAEIAEKMGNHQTAYIIRDVALKMVLGEVNPVIGGYDGYDEASYEYNKICDQLIENFVGPIKFNRRGLCWGGYHPALEILI